MRPFPPAPFFFFFESQQNEEEVAVRSGGGGGKGKGRVGNFVSFEFCARLHSSESTQRSNANVRIYSSNVATGPSVCGEEFVLHKV